MLTWIKENGYINIRQIDFRAKNIIMDKEGFHNDKGGKHQEDKIILNVYALNSSASKNMKQKTEQNWKEKYTNAEL